MIVKNFNVPGFGVIKGILPESQERPRLAITEGSIKKDRSTRKSKKTNRSK